MYLTGKIYTDQTGRFPVTYSKSNKYILVAYHYDSNTIHAEPLKTQPRLDLKTAYQKIHSLLTNRGLKPGLHILDNECPNVLKTFMREVNEKFQLVPHHIHCRNSAERAIRTFKDHFIASLDSTHKDFPLHLWCQLLPHASITINLPRQYRMNPKLSGYDQLHGEFNYNATPLAPPGTQVIIHEKLAVRGTMASHGVKGRYLGPSMNHYRRHCVSFTKERGEWDSDCVELPPHNNPPPYSYSSDFVIIAAHRLAHALKNPAPQAPFSNINDFQMIAIEQLSDIFSKVAYNLHQRAETPQHHPVTKSAIIPHKVRPNTTKPITSEQPNITEDDDGKCSTSFQNKVHMSPSGPHIILPEVPSHHQGCCLRNLQGWTRKVQVPT